MSQETIHLIVPAVAPLPSGEQEDRGGGQYQGLIEQAIRSAVTSVPLEKLSNTLNDVVSKVACSIGEMKHGIGVWEVEEIKIGLSISAEGDVGIASAGMEASIEVSLRRPAAAHS